MIIIILLLITIGRHTRNVLSVLFYRDEKSCKNIAYTIMNNYNLLY